MPRRSTIGLALLLTSLLTGSALAQGGPPLNPPSGPVQAGPTDDGTGPRSGMRGQRGQRGMRAGRPRLPPAVKAMLVQRFDRNGDGRLTGPERIRAKRFLKKQRAKQQRAGAMQPRGGMQGRGGMGGR